MFGFVGFLQGFPTLFPGFFNPKQGTLSFVRILHCIIYAMEYALHLLGCNVPFLYRVHGCGIFCLALSLFYTCLSISKQVIAKVPRKLQRRYIIALLRMNHKQAVDFDSLLKFKTKGPGVVRRGPTTALPPLPFLAMEACSENLCMLKTVGLHVAAGR